MTLKEENQGREPAIQIIACVTTVFKRVCGERWNLSERTREETLDIQVSLLLIKFYNTSIII